MKKRIFIAAHYLELGGAEMSLIGLLDAIDYNRVDVFLFLYQKRGALLSLVPEEVTLLPEIPEYAQIESPIKESIKKGYIRQAWARIKAKLRYRKWAKEENAGSADAYCQYLDDEIMPTMPDLYKYGEFDLAINFIGLRNMIPMKVKYKKAITWIHTDLGFINVNTKLDLSSWERYNHIVSISPSVTESFLTKFPELEDKIIEIENILPVKYIKERSRMSDVEEELSEYGGAIRLLSIGRYCLAKNYDNIPDICKRLVEAGLDVRWMIIGYGIEEDLIKKRIQEAGMENYVCLLGKRTNPYPYIKYCDVYVQPSRYEGKSVTVREAQILGKPVIVTNYNTALSQVKNRVDGVIVPLDNKNCAQALSGILKDTQLLKDLAGYCQTHDYGNMQEVNKIYALL